MPQFEIKRERGGGFRGGGLGLASSFVAQIGGKENYVYAKWKERKKAWPKAARLRLTSPRLVFYGALQHALFATSHSGAKKQLTFPSLSPFPTPYPVLAIRLKPKPLAKRTQHATQIK